MKTSITIAIIFLLDISCSTPTNNEESQSNPETTNQEVAAVPTTGLTETDIRIINALLKGIEKFNIPLPLEMYDAYFNYRTEYLEYIDRQIQPEEGIDSIQTALDANLTEVIIRTREFVMEDYKEFNSIEGRLFSFLYMVKDSSANEFLELMYKNENADSVEVERLKSTYPKL
ncbi:MAG: hypothetical protein RLO17_03660 [Cyclobacteriaceae bacterium]